MGKEVKKLEDIRVGDLVVTTNVIVRVEEQRDDWIVELQNGKILQFDKDGDPAIEVGMNDDDPPPPPPPPPPTPPPTTPTKP